MIIYNEIEPFAVDWLLNLSGLDAINPGVVDPRSIADLEPADVKEATQFHTFAGIGVWSYALRLAGFPDDAAVWTGSCPCQPFSTGNFKREGYDDERHLFPVWRDLITECLPPIIFGEQVASPDGRRWFSDVRAEMEALGYAVGAADLCAAGVGAPHIRQRLFFGAVHESGHVERARRSVVESTPGWLGNTNLERAGRHGGATAEAKGGHAGAGNPAGSVGDATDPSGATGRVEDTGGERREELGVLRQESVGPDAAVHATLFAKGRGAQADVETAWAGATRGAWSHAGWLYCRDGKWRPAQPGTLPLADGASKRVGKLRAYGNAIVGQVAATFIRAFMEALPTSEKA